MFLRPASVAIPFLCLLFLGLCIYRKADIKLARRRLSILISATIVSVYLVLLTEILSFFNRFTYPALLIGWLILLIPSIYLATRNFGELNLLELVQIKNIHIIDWIILSGCLLIVGTVGLIAVIAPPNHWDVLTYHIARVGHWEQNRSVAFYPTHILRQLYTSPWSEYAALHLQVLHGSDRFANVIHWICYSASGVASSILAKQFGAKRRGQILAAAFVVTIPVAILQASTAKNDCAVGFWYVTFCCFFFLLKTNLNFSNALLAGSSLGLALLTKGTAYIFVLPFLVWLTFWSIKEFQWRAWTVLATVAGLCVLINFTFWARNYSLFQSPLGPSYDVPASKYDPTFSKRRVAEVLPYGNTEITFPLFISNVVKNIAVHTVTPFSVVNRFVQRKLIRLHRFMGVRPNDPRTTWHHTRFKQQESMSFRSQSSDPLHFLLILVVIGYLLIRFRSFYDSDLFVAGVVLTISFLLFCLLLRWSDESTRKHIPLWFVAASIVGTLLDIRFRQKWLPEIVALVLLLCAIPWIFYNESRPLIGPKNIFNTSRYDQYFQARNIERYENAAKFIATRGCSQIGLKFIWWNETEYQFWIMLKRYNSASLQIQHVDVENESAKLRQYPPFNEFHPCAILLLDYSRKVPDSMVFNNVTYQTRQSFGDGTARVLMRE